MSITTIEQLTDNLEKLAKKINSRSVNDRLARKCRQIIYRRVKAGYGVNSDTLPSEQTKQVTLKPLSKSYIAYREGKVQFFTAHDGHVYAMDMKKSSKKNTGNSKNYKDFAPTLGPFGRPKKSNATFTGEMMESVSLRSTADGFQLFIPTNRRKDDSGLTNKKVSDFYSADRPFFALTAGEVRILTRELEAIVKELIDRQF